jgi:Zn-dependent protease with chaperone function
MDTLYPEGPTDIPSELTQPSPTYKQRAWLAGACLVGFVLIYLFLAGWFVATAWRLIDDAVVSGGGNFANWLVGGGSAFLAIFMLKALFFIQRGENKDLLELKAADQPRLFEFLYRLADEAGAPRPAHVYLSAKVNAAVFYDLSIINLLFPSRKNLEIGLPLVNVLNLSELKAVLAHEFGHFAQRSMAIGSWVYIAQQIASQIIHRRDALDKFLAGVSRTDLRIAWVGWLLSLIVWSIRSLMDSLLRLVVLAQRSLSRQMEFHADLVAVSLTGSEEIVNALHKLQAADEAWARTQSFANSQLSRGKRVHDLFAVQTRIIGTMARILDDPAYGATPAPGQTSRVFKTGFAHPPQMWSTHPACSDREDNAKRTFISARRDERSACVLFENLDMVKAALAEQVFGAAEGEIVSAEETLLALDERYRLEQYDARYRGAFLGRPLTRHASKADELYTSQVDPSALQHAVNSLYPPVLASDLAKLRDLDEEHACLKALHDKRYEARDKRLVFRGREISRQELPQVMARVRQEAEVLRERVLEHDRRCRSLHLAAAQQLGQGWPEYLSGLIATLHFAEHSEADLRDAQGMLANVFAVVTADGRVSKAKMKRLVAAANELHGVLFKLHEMRTDVRLDQTLLERLKASSWDEMLSELKLPEASAENMGEWLKVVDGWVNSAAGACSALNTACLEQLLCSENQIADALHHPETASPAPTASIVPGDYPIRLIGSERERQTRLGWWDRLKIADGPVFAGIRLLGAGAIVGAVLGFSGSASQESDISVFNGLSQPVQVKLGEQHFTVAPYASHDLSVRLDEKTELLAQTRSGKEIERFHPDLQGHSRHYVYNIAGASPLIEWTATYGNATEVAPRKLGAPRWLAAGAEVYFTDPPANISTKSGGGTRKVLSGMPANADPQAVLKQVDDEQERRRVAAAHVQWDAPDSPHVGRWRALLP